MSEQNVEFVKSTYEAFARGDVPAVLGAFADDVEWFEAEGMPYGGLYRSGEAVQQNVFGPIAADVEGFAVTPEEYIGSGATVAAIVRSHGHRQGNRPGPGPAGSARLGNPRRQAGAL